MKKRNKKTKEEGKKYNKKRQKWPKRQRWGEMQKTQIMHNNCKTAEKNRRIQIKQKMQKMQKKNAKQCKNDSKQNAN